MEWQWVSWLHCSYTGIVTPFWRRNISLKHKFWVDVKDSSAKKKCSRSLLIIWWFSDISTKHFKIAYLDSLQTYTCKNPMWWVGLIIYCKLPNPFQESELFCQKYSAFLLPYNILIVLLSTQHFQLLFKERFLAPYCSISCFSDDKIWNPIISQILKYSRYFSLRTFLFYHWLWTQSMWYSSTNPDQE